MEFSNKCCIFAGAMKDTDTFETYYLEVLSFLDDNILPQNLYNTIEDALRECVYVCYYKQVSDLTTATVVSAFITTFKKFLK